MNKSTQTEDARSTLIREGVDSYTDAMTALAHFHKAIYTVSARIVERNRKEIAQTFGVPLVKITSEEFSEELDTFYEGPDSIVGCAVKIPAVGILYVGLAWRDRAGTHSPRIYAGLYCNRRGVYDRVAKATENRFGARLIRDDSDWMIAIEEAPEADIGSHLESRLGKVLNSFLTKLSSVNVRKLIR